MSELNSFLPFSLIKGKKVLLLTHRGADVDAISSCGALYFSLKKNAKLVIGIPEHINKQAKHLAEKFSIPFTVNPDLNKFDVIILVELNSWKMLGEYADKIKNFSGEKFLIDHHVLTGDKIVSKQKMLVDQKAVSCTQVVLRFLKSKKIKISPKTASLIVCGVITDSGQFYHADEKAFHDVSEMLKISKHPYDKLLSFLTRDFEKGEKIARLKSAKRVKIFGAGDFIIALSEVGAYESQAASALVKIGADAAFVGTFYEKENETVVSGRASYSMVKSGHIDLARNIFVPLKNFFKGEGGGHAGAAAFNCSNVQPEKVLKKCLDLTFENLKKQNSNLKLKKFTD